MAKGTALLSPIPGFERVVPGVWEHIPSVSARYSEHSSDCYKAPSHVLLFPWTGAQNKNISKYTAEYQGRFPSSRILVITTSAKDLCFRSSKRKRERLGPLVRHLMAYRGLTTMRILLHAFSEGGSNKAVELAQAYHEGSGCRLPVSALCLDSTPGHPHYLRLCNALKQALPPHPVLKHTGLAIGSTVLGGLWILFCVFRGFENNPISQTRRRLLDPTHFDLDAPRCYLYSKADALVAWQDVHEHVMESIDRKMAVKEVVFDSSEHCKHAKVEPHLYWEAVMQTWSKAVARSSHVPIWYDNEYEYRDAGRYLDFEKTLIVLECPELAGLHSYGFRSGGQTLSGRL